MVYMRLYNHMLEFLMLVQCEASKAFLFKRFMYTCDYARHGTTRLVISLSLHVYLRYIYKYICIQGDVTLTLTLALVVQGYSIDNMV